ncbi:MAG: disulfide bond formation protein DsbA [Enterovirga sp.]|jgi:2-hydroxychromene-2-carboxylate isomerase|nr:disulfide bond formation protein DsbA [Enterovirga sp.]
MPVLAFWFEFASTYSYLSAMRIEREAASAGVDVAWRPFLLGPIFAEQGWKSSPFNLYPAKGRYMWRDMEREAEALGLPCRKPDPFPQNSLLPARIALLGADRAWGPGFAKAVYRAQFGEGAAISDPALMLRLLLDLGLDGKAVLAEAQSEENKSRLRLQTSEAQARGIFGAPTFIAPDGETFWGNDRLERALAWTVASDTGRS